MKYKFEPVDFRYISKNRYNKRPNFVFNFALYSGCSDSYGIYILFNLDIFNRTFYLCIKPIGEFIL